MKINKQNLINIIENNNIVVFVDFIIKDSNIIIYYFDSKDDSAKLKRLAIEFDIEEEQLLYANTEGGRVTDNAYTFKTYINSKVGTLFGVILDGLPEYKRRKKVFKEMRDKKNYTYNFFNETQLFDRMFDNYTILRERYNDSPNRKGVFDCFRVKISVVKCGQSRNQVIEKIKKHKHVLASKANHIMERSLKDMAKYMKLDNVIYTNDSYLIYTFVFKNENKVE